MKFTTKNIAYLSLIASISVIMNALTLTVPGSGIAIAFTYIPNFLAGFFFGPAAGFLVGVIGDVLGCIIWPKGAWLPLLTLSAGLMGAIPGLIRKIPLPDKWIVLLSYVATYVVCSAGINTFTLWHAYAATKKTFWVYFIGKFPVAFLNMIANLVMTFALMPLFKKIILPRTGKENAEQKRSESGSTVAVEGAALGKQHATSMFFLFEEKSLESGDGLEGDHQSQIEERADEQGNSNLPQ